MEDMLLVCDRRDPSHLVLRANRPWHRALARLLAGSLDRRLAAGRAPESDVLLASRAETLVTPVLRRELAHLLSRHLDGGRRMPSRVRRTPRTPDRDRITAEPALREVVALLGRDGPVPATGVAAVMLLLTDGAGPLFNARSHESLAAALARAASHLDPLHTPAPVT
jgi:hypothetical protein